MSAREERDAHIRRLVAEAPPLTDEQRAKISMLLLPAARKPKKPAQVCDLVPEPLAVNSLMEVLDRG